MFKPLITRSLLAGLIVFSNLVYAQTLQDGLKYIDSEKYGDARKTFYSLVASNPLSAEYQYYLGDFFLKMEGIDTSVVETLDSSKICFVKGIQLDPKFPLNYVGLGAVKYLMNDWDSSAIYFDRAIKMTKKKNATVLFKIAEAYLHKGKKDVKVAIPQLEEATRLEPKNTDIALLLGDAYLIEDEGNGSRAVKQYNQALSINSKLAKAHIKGGKIYLLAKGYQSALEYYNKGIEADPAYAPAYRERAELYFKFKAYRDKAPVEYKKYLDMIDGNYRSKFRYAYFCYEVKDYEDALTQLNELDKMLPNDRIVARLKAYCNYEIGVTSQDSTAAKLNMTEGLDNINKLFALSPDTNKILLSDYEYYGKLLFKTGNDSLGVQYLRKVLGKDSSKFEVFGDVAKFYNTKKMYTKAAENYELYFKFKKPGLNDLLNLGKCYYNNDEFVKADTVFSRLVRLKPEELLGHKYRALCNAKMDSDASTGQGVPFYEKYIELAIAKDPLKYKNDIISGYTYIGKHYAVVKNYPKSKEYWKKIVEIDPANTVATTMLKSLK